jgi:histone H3/H4
MTRERSSERKALARFIQDAIDKGATTVEDIHKSIADLPLKILEESELLRAPAKEVRRVQDHTIGAVYDLIRSINEQIGTVASELLAEAARRRGARGETGTRHHAATH